MKTLFKSELKTSKESIRRLPKEFKEITEKHFIIDFFKQLPIESLKKLINFEEIDFENKELWDIPTKREMLTQLRNENIFKYTCELWLDTDS